jgi:hypothetical protein
MNENSVSSREMIAAAGALGCLALGPAAAHAAAKEDSNLVETDFRIPHKGRTEFELRGENATFGRYSAFGEVVDMKVGDALGVLTDQDGDRIVGVVKLKITSDGPLTLHFSWRDSVRLSNGQTYVNTGKFAHQLPPGLPVVDTGGAGFLLYLRKIILGF